MIRGTVEGALKIAVVGGAFDGAPEEEDVDEGAEEGTIEAAVVGDVINSVPEEDVVRGTVEGAFARDVIGGAVDGVPEADIDGIMSTCHLVGVFILTRNAYSERNESWFFFRITHKTSIWR